MGGGTSVVFFFTYTPGFCTQKKILHFNWGGNMALGPYYSFHDSDNQTDLGGEGYTSFFFLFSLMISASSGFSPLT